MTSWLAPREADTLQPAPETLYEARAAIIWSFHHKMAISGVIADECRYSGVDYRGADVWPKAFLPLLLFSHFLLLALWPHRGPIIAMRRLRCCRARGRGG